jgi:hypothetical protein
MKVSRFNIDTALLLPSVVAAVRFSATGAMTNEGISEGERYQIALRIQILKGS